VPYNIRTYVDGEITIFWNDIPLASSLDYIAYVLYSKVYIDSSYKEIPLEDFPLYLSRLKFISPIFAALMKGDPQALEELNHLRNYFNTINNSN